MIDALLSLASGLYAAMYAALMTLIVVFIFRKFLMKSWGLASGVLPWFSAGIGLIIGFYTGTWLQAGPCQVQIAMLAGPLAGLMWDSFGKYLFQKE